jgi:hypothetical protein
MFLCFFIVTAFTFCNSAKQPGSRSITLKNTADFALTDKAIIIQRKDLGDIPASTFPLITTEKGDTIPAQLDELNGDDQWDELFFVISLPAGQEENVELRWVNEEMKFEKRTSIRFGVRQTKESTVKPELSDTFYADQLPGVIGYQHYQTDGPTWENDKVAFRIYLDGRNSIDVFGKKVKEITPEDVGIGADGVTENNYSVMKDWGTDILGVGNSVGIGGVSLMIQDSLIRLGVTEQDTLNNVDTTVFRILSEGPARSVMHFSYKNWKALARHYQVETTTTIWPGMYGFRNEVRLHPLKGDETLLIGLVNSNTDKKLTEITSGDNWVILLTHDKQSINKEWWMGMALILPKENYLGYIEAPKSGRLSNTYLAKIKVENNRPVAYFAIAAWELSDPGFRDPVYFNRYVHGLMKQLNAEVKVSIK